MKLFTDADTCTPPTNGMTCELIGATKGIKGKLSCSDGSTKICSATASSRLRMKLKGRIKLRNVCRGVATTLKEDISQGICAATGGQKCSVDQVTDLTSNSASNVQCEVPDLEGEVGEFRLLRRRLGSNKGSVVR